MVLQKHFFILPYEVIEKLPTIPLFIYLSSFSFSLSLLLYPFLFTACFPAPWLEISLRSASRRWIASSSSEEYPLGRASPPPGMAGAPQLRATQPPPRILAEPPLGLLAASPQPPQRILAEPPRSLVTVSPQPPPVGLRGGYASAKQNFSSP
jgi:hypothetical protein